MKVIYIVITVFGVLLFQNCGKKSYSDAATSNEPSLDGVDQDGDGVEDLSDDDANDKIDYAESSCLYAAKNLFKAVTLAENSSITGIKNGIYIVNHLSSIEDGIGNVIIYSTNPVGTIDKISNFKGNVVVCGLAVGEISNGSIGNIYVVHGHVGDIDDFKGNVVLLRADLTGQVTNSKMNLLSLDHGGKYSGVIYNQ